MQYIAVHLINQDGSQSNRRYIFHTEATDITVTDVWLCDTQHGIVFGNSTLIENEPNFETKRAVRVTKGIFEQARMYENINKGR